MEKPDYVFAGSEEVIAWLDSVRAEVLAGEALGHRLLNTQERDWTDDECKAWDRAVKTIQTHRAWVQRINEANKDDDEDPNDYIGMGWLGKDGKP